MEKPETLATAIRIGNPARGAEALEVVRKTNGKIIAVSDEEIITAQKLLATEGIWVEPASAAGLAGLMKEVRGGLSLKDKRIVIVATGHGLKDPDIVTIPDQIKVRPTLEEIEKIL